MGNAGDNTKDNTTNSKIVSDELYLYSLKKMADLNAKKNESPLTGLYGIKAFFYEANELMKNNSDKKFAVIRMDIYIILRQLMSFVDVKKRISCLSTYQDCFVIMRGNSVLQVISGLTYLCYAHHLMTSRSLLILLTRLGVE